VGIVAFIVAVATIGSAKDHFTNRHGIIGLVVTLLGVAQPINALLRPKPSPRTPLRIVQQHLLCRCPVHVYCTIMLSHGTGD
jgi:hypothetical protein